METLFFGLIFLVIFGIANSLVWQKINYNWLQKNIKFLIWSLPFEWFPRLDIAGAGFRLSQALTLIGFWFLIILTIKKDPELLKQRFSKLGWILPIFVIISSPSWFNILSFNRFLVHFFGTIICFGASFLIASFENNVFKRLKELCLVIFCVAIFGLYQYIGDILGIPNSLTGLREHYTKIVFGVPRIQGLAIEPLYFAGMLCIPIIFWLTKVFFELFESSKSLSSSNLLLNPKKLAIENKGLITKENFASNPKKLNSSIRKLFSRMIVNNSLSSNITRLVFVFIIFVLTLSKGTYGVLALVLILFSVFAITYFSEFRNLLKKYGLITFILLFWLMAGISNSLDPIALTGEIGKNFVETLSGTSASAAERNKFLSEAIRHLPEKGLQGIGVGQYGAYVGDDLGGLNLEDQAIVNNVYVEVFLEEGLFALIWFVFILLFPLWRLYLIILANQKSINKETSIVAISLFFILLGYYLQWNLFSPIFIMPIFILLGLAYSLVETKFDQK